MGLLRRLARLIVERHVRDVVVLDLDALEAEPDLQGLELTVVNADFGRDKVRALIETALPEQARTTSVEKVARGALVYILSMDGRTLHYSHVSTCEPDGAFHVPEPGEPVATDSWTDPDARGQRLAGLSLNLMGWHAKQAGHRRLWGSVAAWNGASLRATKHGGLASVGRYSLWLFFRICFLRVEHAARGLRRYRLYSAAKWWGSGRTRGAPLPIPETRPASATAPENRAYPKASPAEPLPDTRGHGVR